MKAIFVEGTWEEVAAAGAAFITQGAVSVPVPPAVEAKKPAARAGDDEIEYVSVDVARAVLSRRRLSTGQMDVLRALYEGHPNTLKGTKLQELTGYTRPQFSGLMGALGRRFTHTDGFVEGTWFFEQTWDDDEQTYRYGLPESVREAMRLEKLI